MAAIKYGPGAVDYIADMWTKKHNPTPEEIAKLKELVNKPGEDYFK
jgi:hypothetical protein